jgi:hypothetical protein
MEISNEVKKRIADILFDLGESAYTDDDNGMKDDEALDLICDIINDISIENKKDIL